jgi:hypothetical protein
MVELEDMAALLATRMPEIRTVFRRFQDEARKARASWLRRLDSAAPNSRRR